MTGYVFAGGRSSRMGRDKASLTLGGRTLLDIAMRRLEQVCPAVYLCGPNGITDIVAGEGPLSALVAVLDHLHAADPHGVALVTGVDMPFVEVAVLEEIAERVCRPAVLAAVPLADGYAQPLCAAYRAELRIPLRQAFLAGERRMMHAVRTACDSIRAGRLAEFNPNATNAESFFNLNTAEDFAAAETLWAARYP